MLRLTSILPHVLYLSQMKQILDSMASMPSMLLECVEKLIDDRTANDTLSEM